MRGAALAFGVWAALATCGVADEADLAVIMETPEGWPWLLGDVTGKLGSKKIAWQTYDFSIGAMDASVWAGDPWGPVEFHLTGYTPGDPQSTRMGLRVTAGFGDTLRLGQASGPVEVVITLGSEDNGPRLSSEGHSASLSIASLVRSADNQNYGHVTGTITARLCPVMWEGKSCQDFTAGFDTDMQFDGEFPITFGTK